MELSRPDVLVTMPVRYRARGVYDMAKAKEVHAKVAAMEVGKLVDPVLVEVPYTGIGAPLSRPGGDLVAVGRKTLKELLKLVEHMLLYGGPGSRVYVTGPIGCGKTVLLRELAVYLLKDGSGRCVCIWDAAKAVEKFVKVIKKALSFTYAVDEEALGRISNLECQADVEKFMDERIAMDEQFFFIIDGGEALDHCGVHTLMQKSVVSVICLSPTAERCTRKRKAESAWLPVNDGFDEVERLSSLGGRSLLGRVIEMDPIRRATDAWYYAGSHPLSLTVLNDCCRKLAERRERARAPLALLKIPKEEEMLWELQEVEDWEEVLMLYVSSEELTSVRTLAQQAASEGVKEACHSVKSMAKVDMRYVYGDPDSVQLEAAPCYVNKHIERIYIEEIRNAERETVFEGGAWAPYCRHLLDNGKAVDWAEMGWVCGDFAGEVISMKGLKVEESLKVSNAEVHRFGTVPLYSSWVQEVKNGKVLLFLPLNYNRGSIDGVLVAQIAGKLHLVAIQITTNNDHQQSAHEFMNWERIGHWIPADVRSEWKLHYMFLGLKDGAVKDIQDNVNSLPCGVYYGTVGYRLHVVSFTTAFSGLIADDVRRTLQDIAVKRGSADPIRLENLPKLMLRNIAKFHNVEYAQKDTKEVLTGKIVTKVAPSSLFLKV